MGRFRGAVTALTSAGAPHVGGPVAASSLPMYCSGMAGANDPPVRPTAAQRAQERREQKLADVQKEIDSGRMTRRMLTPEEMEEHAERREELQAQRRKRTS